MENININIAIVENVDIDMVVIVENIDIDMVIFENININFLENKKIEY